METDEAMLSDVKWRVGVEAERKAFIMEDMAGYCCLFGEWRVESEEWRVKSGESWLFLT